jgi:hypothetical protein
VHDAAVDNESPITHHEAQHAHHPRTYRHVRSNAVIEDTRFIASDQISDIGPRLNCALAIRSRAVRREWTAGLAHPDLRPHAFLRSVRARHGHSRRPAKNFVETCRNWWRPIELDEHSPVGAGGLADAIRNGTTMWIDHHASPNLIDGSLDICADAIGIGLAGVEFTSDRLNGLAGASRHCRMALREALAAQPIRCW